MNLVCHFRSAIARLAGRQGRSGAVAALTALVFTALMGFAALAVDVAAWENGRLRAQAVADEAAYAAGLASTDGETASTDAFAVAAYNGFVNQANGATVTVNSPPLSGNYTTDTSAVEVIITQTQTGVFSPFYLATAPTVTGRAVVSASSGTCVILLGSGGLTSSGGGTFNMPGCDFYNDGSTVVSGSPAIDAQAVYLSNAPVGTLSVTAKTYQTNAPPISDPYASRTMPSYSTCNTNVGSTQTYSGGSTPTVFCSGITLSGSGTLTFNNGIYIFANGGLTLSGSWAIDTTNATLIFANGASITGSGGDSFNLTAPASGATAGIAVWVKGTTGLTLSGTSSFNLTGAIYMPKGALTTSGMTGSTCAQLVVASMTMSGNFNFQHNCAGSGTADAGGLTLVE